MVSFFTTDITVQLLTCVGTHMDYPLRCEITPHISMFVI